MKQVAVAGPATVLFGWYLSPSSSPISIQDPEGQKKLAGGETTGNDQTENRPGGAAERTSPIRFRRPFRTHFRFECQPVANATG
jgi:hypothetical protein